MPVRNFYFAPKTLQFEMMMDIEKAQEPGLKCNYTSCLAPVFCGLVFLLCYFCHFEGGGEGGAVLVLAEGGPVHLTRSELVLGSRALESGSSERTGAAGER